MVAGHATGPHPVVAHVQQLVTNHPTGLRHPALSPVLRIRAIGEPDVVVAVAGQVGKGRLFAMSDPSAIINQMLRYPGNRAFVAGLARYLVDDDGATRRQGRLFIVTNRFGEEGSVRRQGHRASKDVGVAAQGDRGRLRRGAARRLPGLGAPRDRGRRPRSGSRAWVSRASARPYRSPLPRYARRHAARRPGRRRRPLRRASPRPSSPRSLALLELKSALYEGLQREASACGAEPAPEALGEAWLARRERLTRARTRP